jgi:hypothetical protein
MCQLTKYFMLHFTHQLSPVSTATNLYRANQFNLDHRDSVESTATLV